LGGGGGGGGAFFFFFPFLVITFDPVKIFNT